MIKYKESITPQSLYQITNNGYDIYSRYLGKIYKIMCRPWGKRESKLSWGIYYNGEIWKWKDFATGEVGSPIDFVMRYHSISFQEALLKVKIDLGGNYTTKYTINPAALDRSTIIKFSYQKYKARHHAYWNCVEVTEEDCKKENCYAIKDLSINNNKVNINSQECVFGFYAEDIDKVKIYFPERERRFFNNAPYRYLWGIKSLPNTNKSLVIQKSYKDKIVTSLLVPTIATQNESLEIFTPEVITTIEGKADNIYLFYGSDPDGEEKSNKITTLTEWEELATPKNELPAINDVYGYVKKYSLIKLQELLKTKNVI